MTSEKGEWQDGGSSATVERPVEGHLDVFVEVLSNGARFVRLCPRGVLTRETVLRKLRSLISEPGLSATVPALWDFRGFDFDPYELAVCRREILSLAQLPQRKGALRAFVVDSELGYGTIRMAQEVLSGHGIEDMRNLHVTYSFDDALAWIAEQLRQEQ